MIEGIGKISQTKEWPNECGDLKRLGRVEKIARARACVKFSTSPGVVAGSSGQSSYTMVYQQSSRFRCGTIFILHISGGGLDTANPFGFHAPRISCGAT
ncbi:hypothetical protein TNCV_3211631 [Trichonephila clavipes]|uniref:Uncharacterized protein n=1 Tax=Trichonephila clavipes TaxID=2585209 RepID=A0A8X6S0H9_TRICX|nr:hypothetical protein TNCV_3211631 [Trichonephila clavipes]